MLTNAGGDGQLFLGLDASTQALKASLLTRNLNVQAELEVRFDRDLPHFGTQGGTLQGPHGTGIVYSPVMILVEAIDLLFEGMKRAHWPLDKIRGVSAAGQQHASVYWSKAAASLLNDARPNEKLAPQLCGAFSRNSIPNWQDSSTLEECAELERGIGGADKLARLTGSKAHARFTGPQIMRFRKTEPSAYEQTWRISLVSSFMTTLLCLDGEVKGIDESDACGMNLWNMSTPERGWANEAINIVAGEAEGASQSLLKKLGYVESDGGRVVGRIGQWYVDRFGFSPECIVCPGTGDNPATFLSFTLRENEGLISLGTSDTVLVSTSTYNPDAQFHAFFHPAQIVAPSKQDGKQSVSSASGEARKMQYFNMLVYKNGSLAREFVRDHYFDGSWDAFNAAVQQSLPSHAEDRVRKIGFWWLKPEIIPTNAQGIHKFEEDQRVEEYAQNADNAIAMLSSQFLSYRSRSSRITGSKDYEQRPLARIFATGGAASNTTICRLLADVLGCDVCKPVVYIEKDVNQGKGEGAWHDANFNACSVAAAYKAAWSWSRHSADDGGNHKERLTNETFDEFIARAAERRRSARLDGAGTDNINDANIVEEGVAVVARPDKDRSHAFRDSVDLWRSLEQQALSEKAD